MVFGLKSKKLKKIEDGVKSMMKDAREVVDQNLHKPVGITEEDRQHFKSQYKSIIRNVHELTAESSRSDLDPEINRLAAGMPAGSGSSEALQSEQKDIMDAANNCKDNISTVPSNTAGLPEQEGENEMMQKGENNANKEEEENELNSKREEEEIKRKIEYIKVMEQGRKEEDFRHAKEEVWRTAEKVARQEEALKWYVDARDVLTTICSNKTKYDRLQSLDLIHLQLVLDLMQMVLEHSYTRARDFENVLLKVMLRVAKRHTLCPNSYVLSDITRGEYPIASGNFGEVFQGDHRGQKLSLKVFKLYSSELSKVNELIMAFYKEAILWRHLSHRNLLPFYGIYQLSDSGKRICLVSPWMNEGNVTQYLEWNPQANRRYLALDVARGISYLHRKSIVHGDLKGVNVLVSETGVACLADFGLSSVILNTRAGVLSSSTVSTAGTVRWQAPELIGGSDDSFSGRTKESDMYAFACVCHEIFVGKMPFYEILNDYTVMYKVTILGQRPLRPEVDSDPYTQWGLTDWIWSLLEECWNQDPAARPLASDVVVKFSSRNEFLRDDDDEHGDWGDLHPEMFRSLIRQQPSLLQDDIQRCLALLNTL